MKIDNMIEYDKRKALVLIRTKLQALVALSILKLKKHASSSVDVIFVNNLNDSDNKYIQDLFVKYCNSFKVVRYGAGGARSQLSLITKVYSEVNEACYSHVYISSFDLFCFRLIVFKKCNNEIITFDDGTGYYGSHSCFSSDNVNYFDCLLSLIFNIPARHKFINSVSEHFSLNPNIPSVMKGVATKRIEILEEIKDIKYIKGDIRVFLGTVLTNESSIDFENMLKLEIFSDQDYYIPHPRSEDDLLSNIAATKLDGITAELIIANLIEDGYQVELIGFFSSVFFNISSKSLFKKIYVKETDNNQSDIRPLISYIDNVEVKEI